MQSNLIVGGLLIALGAVWGSVVIRVGINLFKFRHLFTWTRVGKSLAPTKATLPGLKTRNANLWALFTGKLDPEAVSRFRERQTKPTPQFQADVGRTVIQSIWAVFMGIFGIAGFTFIGILIIVD